MDSQPAAGFCSSISLLDFFLSNLFRLISNLSSNGDEGTNKSTMARAENIAAQKQFRQVQHIKGF